MQEYKLKVLELFGGIGACTKALTRLGIKYEVVDYVEVNKYAVNSYNAINGTNFKPQDITKWDKNISPDLIMHGSPCQDFSLAGKNEGGNEGSGTRSSLMYETIRIVEKLRPKYVIWENVRNLLSPRHVNNFNKYLNKLEELGYKNFYQVLNAKDYGIPQNRERIFTISIQQDDSYIFPSKQELKLKLKDMLENEVDEKFYISEKTKSELIVNATKEYLEIKEATKKGYCKAYEGDSVNIERPNSKTRRGRVGKQVAQTLQTSCNQGVVVKCKDGLGIRMLTPLEYWRLLGFKDEDFMKAEKINSNTQLYKQAGNSIVVNVLEAILKNLLIEKEKGIYQTNIFDFL